MYFIIDRLGMGKAPKGRVLTDRISMARVSGILSGLLKPDSDRVEEAGG